MPVQQSAHESSVDVYFSADVETDGPIPGPFSILSLAFVYAGCFDGNRFRRPENYQRFFYKELRPISDRYEPEAMAVNGLDRERLLIEGENPGAAMSAACDWIKAETRFGRPVLVAYPLSFDWSFLYWYFIQFSAEGSPFGHSRCLDIKTAFALKASIPISDAGLANVWSELRPNRKHSHNALDDAIEQAEIFANVFEWSGAYGRATK